MKLLQSVFDFLYGMLLKGLMVKLFYGWFILPVFNTLPQINYLQAIGIGAFLYLFNPLKAYEIELSKEREETDLVKYGKYLIPPIALGMGYLTHLIITLFS